LLFTELEKGPGSPSDLVQDYSPFGALQFTVNEVQSVLLELDVRKGASPHGIPLILKNCAFAFALPLFLLFNRSFSTFVFVVGVRFFRDEIN
jgi:hypothetical protein